MTIVKKTTRKVSPDSSTQFNIAHQDMLTAVTLFGLRPDNLPITGSVPAFNTLLTTIQGNLGTVASLRTIARSPITGFAAQKKFAKTSLVAFSVNVMNAAYSYATTVGNQLLASQTLTSTSKLGETKYTVMLERVQAAIADITPFANDGSLSSYNVTPATIASWQSIKDQATVVLTNPENAIAHREAINISIQRLLHDSMVQLTNAGDTLIYQFRSAYPDYFNMYWANRHLHEHTISTQLRMTVKDQNDQPITQGEVFIEGTDRNALLDDNGYALVNHIPFGNHKVMLTTMFGDFDYGVQHFKKGKSLTMNVTINTLQKSIAPKVTVTEEETPVTVEK